MSNKVFTLLEYIKEFPLKRNAKEFWKLFKVRGALDNRHLSFNVCRDCANTIYNDKEKLKIETDKESNLSSILISFRLCEDCAERNVYEVNSYIFWCGYKRRNQKNTVATENNEEKKPFPFSYIPISKKSKSNEE